jgi:transcriptional regulator with PAS, ATPase and Fis domain
MIEGELFGYMKGAFTGATSDFGGMIAEAEGSTLFLDEISEMPAELQTRFLRVLQEREFRPLGSTKTLKADFRVVAATNRPVEQALVENRLRSDLITGLTRSRSNCAVVRAKEDIPPLITTFVRSFAQQLGSGTGDFAGAFQKLLDYGWLVNARVAKRDGIRSRPRAPGPDHGEGIAE